MLCRFSDLPAIGRLHYYVNAQRLLVVVVKFAPNNDENGMAKLSRVNFAMYSNFEIWK